MARPAPATPRRGIASHFELQPRPLEWTAARMTMSAVALSRVGRNPALVRTLHVSLALVAFGTSSCRDPGALHAPSGGTPVEGAAPAAATREPASAVEAGGPVSDAPGSPRPPAPAVETPAAEAGPPFPPAAVAVPSARSAQPGDGIWVGLGPEEEGVPFLMKTVVRPHETSRFLTVHVVAIDLRRLELHYLPGTEDVVGKRLPDTVSPGRVPPQHRAGIVAAFNGGFMPQHGRWGMKVSDFVVVPPRENGCTVATLPSARPEQSVRIAPWPELAAEDARIPAYRQTPPCLLDRGELHADLKRGQEKPWGGFNPNLVTRRRSAVGLDASGTILFYAVGIEVGPRLLAEALAHAGAAQAAELDINDNWTRFALFALDEAAGEPRVERMLLDDMVKQKSGYVARPSERDFFYLVRRPARSTP